MKVEQISIFLENKPGGLSEVTRILKENNINIRALSLADTTDFGILRLIVNDVEKAKEKLKAAGLSVGRIVAHDGFKLLDLALVVAAAQVKVGQFRADTFAHQRPIGELVHQAEVKLRRLVQIAQLIKSVGELQP